MDWDNPKDLNEKINWLKYNTDTSEWTRLSDKYLVRDFIKERGFADILVPLYAKWNTAEEIDFNVLPDQFVIKTNHGSRDIFIVKEKSKINEVEIREAMKKHLAYTYGFYQGEPHYMNIKPCIVAEKLLIEKENHFSTSLVDYKVWCFNGEPFCIWTCYSRTSHGTSTGLYDLDWHYHPEHSIYDQYYKNGGDSVPKPKSFDKMMETTRALAKGFPEVRVDFYDVDGRLYFGEMTFTSMGGYMPFFTQEWLMEMGNQINLK